MKRLLTFLFVLSIVLSFSQVLVFENANVHYPEGYKDLAVRIGTIFENVRDDTINLVGNDPGRVNIFLRTGTTITNGYANYLEKNTIVLYTWHPAGVMYNYLPFGDWYRYLIIHEFTHIVSLRNLTGILRTFADFGMPYNYDLGVFSAEAQTLFAESSFLSDSGRLNSPLNTSLMKTLPAPSQRQALPVDSLANDYRYGLITYNANGSFYDYLVKKYGIEKVQAYVNESMQNSISWPEIVLNFSVPVSTFRFFASLFQDNFKKHFGVDYVTALNDWLKTLPEFTYPETTLYNGQNERIHKIEKDGDRFYLLVSSFGAVSGYFDRPFNKLVVLNERGTRVREIPLSANDFRVENGKIYALVYGKDEMEIWNVTDNVLITKGKISAFDIQNGKVYYTIYDDKSDTSKFVGFGKEITVKGFVRNFAYNGEEIYYLVGNSLWKMVSYNTELLDNVSMKGAFLKKSGKNVFVPMALDGKMELVNVKNFTKVTDGAYAFDGLVDRNVVYYVDYTNPARGYGMSVYKTDVHSKNVERNVVEEKYKLKTVDYKEGTGFESASYSLTPSMFLPFIGGIPFVGWGVGSGFVFTDSLTHYFIFPYYLNLSIQNIFSANGAGIVFGLFTDKAVGTETYLSSANIFLYDLNSDKSGLAGTSSVGLPIFRFKTSPSSDLSTELDISTNYSIQNWEKVDYSVSGQVYFNYNFDKNTLGFSVGTLYDSSETTFFNNFGVDYLSLITQEFYLYASAGANFKVIDFDSVNFSAYAIMNAFPFYKQSGIGVGGFGEYNANIQKFKFVLDNFLYVGLPQSNTLYLKIGVRYGIDGTLVPYYGLTTKPHQKVQVDF